MSIIEYRESMYLAGEGSFYGLLMACMRNADTDNVEKLKQAFPEVWNELQQRYNAPGGALTDAELDWVVEVTSSKETNGPKDEDDEDEEEDDLEEV